MNNWTAKFFFVMDTVVLVTRKINYAVRRYTLNVFLSGRAIELMGTVILYLCILSVYTCMYLCILFISSSSERVKNFYCSTIF